MKQPSTISSKAIRFRKFALILPVLVLPFLTFLLWSFKLIGANEKAEPTNPFGFNTHLPGAITGKDSNWNKLKFYEQADKDSARYRSLLKTDPYYQLSPSKLEPSSTPIHTKGLTIHSPIQNNQRVYPYTGALQQDKDTNEEKVIQKINELNAVLQQSSPPVEEISSNMAKNKPGTETLPTVDNSADFSRTAGMIENGNIDENTGDPEMQQIDGMLDKILDIQHPDRIKNKIREQSHKYKRQVFPVSVKKDQLSISLLKSNYRKQIVDIDSVTINIQTDKKNSFYSFTEGYEWRHEDKNAINAVIQETQTLVTGSTVKLRLRSEVFINGVLIPKDHLIFGEASLSGERLKVNISTIRFRNSILPVELTVYDLDGIEGMYMPGAITRDVTKQSTDQAIQSMSLASLDPSIGAQAATAGIQAAKTLIGKKTKLVRVTVKAGYEVLLLNSNLPNE